MKLAIITALFLAAGAAADVLTVCTTDPGTGFCAKYDKNGHPTGDRETCRAVLEFPRNPPPSTF
ncbi:hypothetical protein EG328_002001 [Venturia inaequalis]|uniref:Uncharacterized protein n=1 Tax=Venturia inaequalis TaxID=5025 RepID=A0A8H3UVT1_VENIN|nr:hypothetical protein EG328_002001 [Venturia inaequalis]KAE9980406.1 hypothetical protein EG327_006568 [Venturia inaequalis]